MTAQTLYDKIWQQHVVKTYDDGTQLLYIDRHLVQEVSSPQAFSGLVNEGRALSKPFAHIAVADHVVPTRERKLPLPEGLAAHQLSRLESNCKHFNIRYLDLLGKQHGIVHVIGPELGFTLPGITLVCGDSHTSTHGAFGSIAFGIGASECECVFATQTLRQRKQKTMRATLVGNLQTGVTVKDIILALIVKIGTSGGVGHAIEYSGSAIASLSMEARMTLCNMSIEAGSRVGMVAPDEKTFAYVKGRPLAPQGEQWEAAIAHWKTLHSDPDAKFDKEVELDVSKLVPHVSWGTNPGETAPISTTVPDPKLEPDLARRAKMERSLQYMDLTPGVPLTQISIDKVFIGSCTNGRIEDLRLAAKIVKGRVIALHVVGIVVPGSASVRLQAEHEGLDIVFKDAGFEWRNSGCSMCVAMNDDRLQQNERCASTSNRNFEGRQGKGGRTHLMSPPMAAAAAIAGRLTDVRTLERLQ